MQIRKATKADLESITGILNQGIRWGRATAYLEELLPEQRQEWFENHGRYPYAVFIAEDADDILGYLSLGPYRAGKKAFGHVAEVSYFVDFSHHRKGIAGRMMDHALLHCRKEGIDILLAFLYANNLPSIHFLEKYGFKVWGRFPRLIRREQTTIDQVVYGLMIKDSAPHQMKG